MDLSPTPTSVASPSSEPTAAASTSPEVDSKNESSSSENENPGAETPEDLDVFVKELMDNMQNRFSRLSDTILGRIDDMGSKIDELEKNITELMDEAGMDSLPSESMATTKTNGVSNKGTPSSKRLADSNSTDAEF